LGKFTATRGLIADCYEDDIIEVNDFGGAKRRSNTSRRREGTYLSGETKPLKRLAKSDFNERERRRYIKRQVTERGSTTRPGEAADNLPFHIAGSPKPKHGRRENGPKDRALENEGLRQIRS
jgi:hypothetical protein